MSLLHIIATFLIKAPDHCDCMEGSDGPNCRRKCKNVQDGPFCRPVCPLLKYANEQNNCTDCHTNCLKGWVLGRVLAPAHEKVLAIVWQSTCYNPQQTKKKIAIKIIGIIMIYWSYYEKVSRSSWVGLRHGDWWCYVDPHDSFRHNVLLNANHAGSAGKRTWLGVPNAQTVPYSIWPSKLHQSIYTHEIHETEFKPCA